MFTKTFRSVVSLLLVSCLLLGLGGNAVVSAVSVEGVKNELTNGLGTVNDKINDAIDRLESEVERLDAIVADTEATLLKYEAQLIQGQKDLDAAKADLAAAQVELDELKEQAAQAPDSQEKAKIEKQLAEKQAEIDGYNVKAAEAQALIDEANEKLPVAFDTVEAAKATLADAKASIAALKECINGVKSAVKNVQISLNYVTETGAAVKEDVDALIDAVKALDDSLVALTEAAEGLGEEIPEELTKIQDLRDAVYSKIVTVLGYVGMLDDIIEKVLLKFGIEVDITMEAVLNLGKTGPARVYNFLLNNPDKVVGFAEKCGVKALELVLEYGPYALDLLVEHHEALIKVLQVAGYVGINYGIDALLFAYDHSEMPISIAEKLIKFVGGKLANKYGDEAKSLVQVYVDYLKLHERYNNATHADYITDTDSLYVAIGDNSVVGESYVDLLAYELAVETQSLLANGTNIQSVVAANKDLLAKADLISIGYSLNTCNDTMMSRIETILFEGTYEPIDWAALVGEAYAPKVEAAIAELKNELLAYGVSGNFPDSDLKMSDVLTIIAECYVYEYIGYVWNCRQALNDIQAINPDAQIILVGMYNPFEGVKLNIEGHNIPFGAMMDTLVETVDLYYLACALVNDNVIFVNAPAVENELADGVYEIYPLLYNLYVNGTDQLYATENGHEYIKDQIWNALTLKLLGDVDCDKDIDNVDAMRALQSYVQMVPQGAVCDRAAADVDNDGDVDNIDAMFILQHYVGLRDAF